MTFFLLIIWWISGSSPELAEPWSTWFCFLAIAALADLLLME